MNKEDFLNSFFYIPRSNRGSIDYKNIIRKEANACLDQLIHLVKKEERLRISKITEDKIDELRIDIFCYWHIEKIEE